MNLQSKRVRVPITALGVTALIAGAGALATPAFAADPLALNPSATSFTTVNVGSRIGVNPNTAGSLIQSLANAAYALDVTTPPTSSANGFRLKLDDFTPPTGVTVTGTPTLSYVRQASGSANAPTTGWAGLTLANPGTTDVTADLAHAEYDTYFTANKAGTYKFHLYDTLNTPGTDDDKSTGPITMTVVDATNESATTSDDWKPVVTVPATAGIGDPVQAKVAISSAALADARGSSAGKGILGSALNSLLSIGFTGAPLPAAIAPANGSFDGTMTSRTTAVSATTGPGALTTTVAFNTNGDGTLGDQQLTTASTSVASSGVTSVSDLAATDITGAVKTTGGNTVAVKPSETGVTYSALVHNSATATDIENKTVYFTVGVTNDAAGAATLAKITSDGTLVDSSATSKVFTAKTNASGKATLKVTTAGAANLDTYTLTAASNGQVAAAPGPASLAVTYANAVASSVKVTSTSTDLTVSAGSAVTIKGAIYDQFGAAVTPTSSASQQAQLFANAPTSTCPDTAAGAPISTTAAGVQNATVTGGTFQFTYTPTSTPTAGQCAAFRIGYDANGNNSISTTESDTGQVNYASASDAAAISITAPAEASTAGLQGYAGLSAGAPVTGVVTDASSATVAYKSVKLTGGDGVYFSTVASPAANNTADDLVKELTVVTNASGGYTAYVFYTQTGSHKITVASGATATKSVNVTVNPQAAGEYYKVSVDDVAGIPGDTLIVTGTVVDLFGNPVKATTVTLTADPSSIGTLGNASVVTNDNGVFSTSFSTGSNSDGEVTLTASLPGAPTNRVAGVTYKANAGLTFDDGVSRATGKITVKKTNLTLTGPAKATVNGANGAKFNLKGTFLPNTTIDIYGKPSGNSAYELQGSKLTDEDGKYVFETVPARSTTYLAKSSGLSSGALEVTVFSKVSLTATAMGKGKVKLTANGDPNVIGPLKFYRSVAGTDPKVGSLTSSASGSGSVTVKVAKGSRKFYATFKAPGTDMGTSKIVTVKVK